MELDQPFYLLHKWRQKLKKILKTPYKPKFEMPQKGEEKKIKEAYHQQGKESFPQLT